MSLPSGKVLLQIYRFRYFKLQFSGEAEGKGRKPHQLYFLICLWHMLMENCWKFSTVVEEKGRKKHLTTIQTDKETQPLPFPFIVEPHATKGQYFNGYSFSSYDTCFNLRQSPSHLNSRTTAIATLWSNENVILFWFFSFLVTPFVLWLLLRLNLL